MCLARLLMVSKFNTTKVMSVIGAGYNHKWYLKKYDQVVDGVHQTGKGEWGYCDPACPCKSYSYVQEVFLHCASSIIHCTSSISSQFNQYFFTFQRVFPHCARRIFSLINKNCFTAQAVFLHCYSQYFSTVEAAFL